MALLKHISSSLPDDELVQQYKQGQNLQVLGQLYQRYMDLVYGVCLKYLKEPEDAKDSVLLIFEELITKLQKHEVEHFKNWLYSLTKNHCLMRLRSEKNKRPVNLDVSLMQLEDNVHLDNELEKEENFEQLNYCLSLLTSEQRQVIQLFYLESKCYNQIVEETGLEWNKVRSHIQNGRRNLKLCMEKQKIQSTL